jgi:GAF domain-containing protein
MRTYRIALDDRASAVAHVIRTNRPLRRSAIQIDGRLAQRRDSRVADIHRKLAPRSALVVPIHAGDGVLGALSLCYAESNRIFTARDVPAAARMARRIARALTPASSDGSLRLPAAARDARQGPTTRRRLAARN